MQRNREIIYHDKKEVSIIETLPPAKIDGGLLKALGLHANR
jgi:hypothetical protein